MKIRSLFNKLIGGKLNCKFITSIVIPCFFSYSCGKSTTKKNASQEIAATGSLESTTIKLTSKNNTYRLKQLADIKIPASINFSYTKEINRKKVDSGRENHISEPLSAKIFFAKNDPIEEIYCLYKKLSDEDNNSLGLEDCYVSVDHDNDGHDDNLNFQALREIVLLENHLIKLSVEPLGTKNSELEVSVLIDVDWH